jgi:hypothetical protein
VRQTLRTSCKYAKRITVRRLNLVCIPPRPYRASTLRHLPHRVVRVIQQTQPTPNSATPTFGIDPAARLFEISPTSENIYFSVSALLVLQILHPGRFSLPHTGHSRTLLNKPNKKFDQLLKLKVRRGRPRTRVQSTGTSTSKV